VSHGAAPIWSVVREPNASLACDASDVPVVSRSEWVRIFLGRAVSFANALEDGRGAEYLVLGTDAARCSGERAGLARAALEADFASLKKLVAQHRELLDSTVAVADAEIMTRAYATLRRVTVPEDPRCWRCTDEGLSIVRWGLEGVGRPLLSWTEDELERQRTRVLEHHPALHEHGGTEAVARTAGPRPVVESIVGQPRKPAPAVTAAPAAPAVAAPSAAAPHRAPAASAVPAAAAGRRPASAASAPSPPPSPRPAAAGHGLLRSPAAWGVIASVFALGALLGVILAKLIR
jgi:hypothetical protein